MTATSLRTLQRRCNATGTTAGDCLDFVWCVRARNTTARHWDPQSELAHYCTDQRTLRQLLEKAGFTGASKPTLAEFLNRQRIITAPKLLQELRDALVRL